MTKISRIVVVGGCHARGHGVGFESSYSNKIAAGIPDSSLLFVSKPTSVKNAKAAILNLVADLSQDDLVVVQLGNFETGVNLVDGFSRHSSDAPTYNAKGRVDAWRRQKGFKPLANAALKLPILYGLDVLGRPAFSQVTFEKQVAEFFDWLQSATPAKIVNILPFYSLQPNLNVYRLRASNVLRVACVRRGIPVVDPFQSLSEPSLLVRLMDGHPFFFDNEHLNSLGHSVVAESVLELVDRELK